MVVISNFCSYIWSLDESVGTVIGVEKQPEKPSPIFNVSVGSKTCG